MAQVQVVTDQYPIFAQRLQTLTRVMTTKASIAQTSKKLVWTLNKAKLYRYVPVVSQQERHRVPLLLIFALMNRPSILDLRPGAALSSFSCSAAMTCTCWTGAFRVQRTST